MGLFLILKLKLDSFSSYKDNLSSSNQIPSIGLPSHNSVGSTKT